MNMKRKIKISYKPGNDNNVPMIRIANQYLKNCGFNVGDVAKIEYQQNKLIIKKVEVRSKSNEQEDVYD